MKSNIVSAIAVALALRCLLLPDVARAQYSFTQLRQYADPGTLWWLTPIEGTDGMLYSTVVRDLGDGSGTGSAVRMHKDGSAFQVIFNFQTLTGGVFAPYFLSEVSNGKLYGFAVSFNSQPYMRSLLYRMNKDGTGFEVLSRLPEDLGLQRDFVGVDLAFETSDGWLYGFDADFNSRADVFRCRLDGSQFTLLHSFLRVEDGEYPGRPILGSDGLLALEPLLQPGPTYGAGVGLLTAGTDGFSYGRSVDGGKFNQGTAFRVRPNGTDFAILYHFGTTSPDDTYGGAVSTLWDRLLVLRDSSLYGTTGWTVAGPPYLFRLSPPQLRLSASRSGDRFLLTGT